MSYDDVEKIPFLRGTYEGMTKSERRIAEYIAADPERLMKLTIPHIAAETDSSEITVSRFCKKLGYKGLQELKQALTAYLSILIMRPSIGLPPSCGKPGELPYTVSAIRLRSVAI